VDDERLAGLHAALAHPLRVAAVRLLARAGPEGLTAGAIARSLSATPSNMSHHLAALTRGGIATIRRSGNELRYALDVDGAAALRTHANSVSVRFK